MTRTRIRALPGAAVLAILAGCGGYAPHPSDPEGGGERLLSAGGESAALEREPEPEGSVEDYEERIADYADQLHAQLAEAGRPVADGSAVELMQEEDASGAPAPTQLAPGPAPPTRCQRAADLRERICELAGRICSLAGQHPADPQLTRKCEAATEACEQARADVAAGCED
jgi:hypothetical protein